MANKVLFLILSMFLFTSAVFSNNLINLKKVNDGSNIVNTKAQKLSINKSFGKIQLYFIENRGQVNKKALFYVKTRGYTLWTTKTGIVFDSVKREKDEKEFKIKGKDIIGKKSNIKRDVQELRFIGANLNPQLLGENKTDYKVNYFIGKDKSKWKRDISTYSSIIYKSIYKDIDLKVYGKESLIEYDWNIAPGADPKKIAFEYRGVKTHIDKDGNIIIEGKFGNIIHKKPASVQDGKKIEVGFKKLGNNRYGFKVGRYNKKKHLIIDPLVLVYSTYLGGSISDYGKGIVLDSSGCAYITGETSSTDFPIQAPYQSTKNINNDAFITKFSSTGNTLVYSTYLGGSDDDVSYGIAVDSSGAAYIMGETSSTDFPTNNPYQGTNAGFRDAFITKLSSSGNALVYSTYLGGSDFELAYGIVLDSSNNAYITGATSSTDFPLNNPYQGTNAGGRDAFIAKLSSTGNSLVYSTYLGGSGLEYSEGIVIDSSNCTYITGYTRSTDFPVSNAYQGTNAGDWDAFITKLSSSGDSLEYSTYLGGSNSDVGYGITLDSSGCAYITGETDSTDFPTLNPYQGISAGDVDAFVTKFSSSGNTLVYSTYLGGSFDDNSYEIALDSSNCVYITGFTNSTDFPVNNFYQGTNAGNRDVFITKFSNAGNSLEYSTYLGGANYERSYGIAVDSSDCAYITGYTSSTDFPVNNSYQGINAGGNYDSFVTKLRFVSAYTVNASVSGGNGSVFPSAQSVNQGNNASITITPDTGYEINTITDNGVSQTISNPYIINNVQADHTVVVTFEHSAYTVNASVSGGNGSVSPATQTINQGNNASITITPDTGYEIDTITDNGVSRPVSNPYVIRNIQADHTVIVIFKHITYTVNASVSGGNGSVSPATQTINQGSNAKITIIPNSEYEIDTITDNGVSQSIANPYTINNVQADHTVIVIFKHVLYPPALSLTGVRKTERAWIIKKEYNELKISIVEDSTYPMPVSRFVLYKKVNGTWQELQSYSTGGNYNYIDKYMKKGDIANYKLVAYSDTSVIVETGLSL